jgi:hypothetical protein
MPYWGISITVAFDFSFILLWTALLNLCSNSSKRKGREMEMEPREGGI